MLTLLTCSSPLSDITRRITQHSTGISSPLHSIFLLESSVYAMSGWGQDENGLWFLHILFRIYAPQKCSKFSLGAELAIGHWFHFLQREDWMSSLMVFIPEEFKLQSISILQGRNKQRLFSRAWKFMIYMIPFRAYCPRPSDSWQVNKVFLQHQTAWFAIVLPEVSSYVLSTQSLSQSCSLEHVD